MSLAQTLLQADVWFAFFLFIFAAILVMPLADYAETKLPSYLLRWQWEHVAMPLLRVLLLLLFITLSYPKLYGMESAAPLSTILSSESGHVSQLINVLFVLSVLLSLIPIVGEWQALTLPLQGVTAVALIFNWMPGQQTPLACYWPDILTVLVLFALAWLGFRLAVLLGQTLGHWFDRQYHVIGSHEMIGNILLLILQGPLVVIYAHSLGTCTA